jgi:hypothetical protein
MTEADIIEQYGLDFFYTLAAEYKPKFDPRTRVEYWQEWQIERVERDLQLLGLYNRE